MGPPVVVVDLPEGDRASPFAAALLDACSRNVVQGRCAFMTPAADANVVGTAIVRWADDERRAITLSVTLQRAPHAPLGRALEFRDADAMRERWRAAGLVLATLIGEAERHAREASGNSDTDTAARTSAKTGAAAASATATADEERARADPAARARAAREAAARAASTERAREVVWIDGGAFVDPALGGDWSRVGAWLRASVRPWSAPLRAVVGGRYGVAPAPGDRLSLAWASGSLGASWPLIASADPIGIDVHASALVQLARARATDARGASEGRDRAVWGGRAGVDLVWRFVTTWGLVLGAEATVLSSGTVLRVASQREGRDASVAADALLGVRAILR